MVLLVFDSAGVGGCGTGKGRIKGVEASGKAPPFGTAGGGAAMGKIGLGIPGESETHRTAGGRAARIVQTRPLRDRDVSPSRCQPLRRLEPCSLCHRLTA